MHSGPRPRNCNDAARPLQLAVDSSLDPSVQRRAALELGACRVVMRQPDEAVLVLAPLLDGADSALAGEAALWHGRAELQRGAYGAAVRDLQLAAPDSAAFDLARAYGAMDSVSAARRVLHAQLAAPYHEDDWRLALESLGAHDAAAAGDLAEALAARTDLTAGERARLLLADGARWEEAGEVDRAALRFAAAAEAAPDSLEGGVARARLVLLDLRRAADLAAVPELLERAREAGRAGREAARLARPAEDVLAEVAQALERAAGPDAAVLAFGAAELLRDSLAAHGLAAALFWSIHQDHPGSFVAPKALLAAAALDPTRAQAARSLLTAHYGESPYARALTGEAGEAFSVAEDSLRALQERARRRP